MAIPASQRPCKRRVIDFGDLAAGQILHASGAATAATKAHRDLGRTGGSALVNDALPLGIHVGAPPPAAFVAINGLPAGARLTSGRRVANEWRVPASEISGVSVIPSDGFVVRCR
jgi:hypothetical protein